MILSDASIMALKDTGVINFWRDGNVQPASYDVRLSPYFVRADGKVEHADVFTLPPGELVLASTLEFIRVPDDLVVHVEGRSSWGRLGLLTHITAGYIDPGFEGNVTLELYNVGPHPLELHTGLHSEPIAQLVFMRLDRPAVEPYSSSRGSKYQMSEGPVASKLSRFQVKTHSEN